MLPLELLLLLLLLLLWLLVRFCHLMIVSTEAPAEAATGVEASAAASALLTEPIYRGIATAASTPKIIVTIINSISVKPLLFLMVLFINKY